MEKTRKLPVGHDPSRPTRKFGHMVPKFSLGIEGEGFIAVDSAKEAMLAHVAYLGCDVTSADILAKVRKKGGTVLLPDEQVVRRLDRFLLLLQEFKIGYLLKAEITKGDLELVLVSKFSMFEKPLPLP